MSSIEEALLETRFPDLSEKERILVEMRANGVSMSVIAKRLEVSRVTLYKWLERPEVATALTELHDDGFRAEGGDTILTEISTILMGIARNPLSEDKDRIRACQVMLNQAADYYQRRFVARRMDKLEARIMDALNPTVGAIEASVSKQQKVENALEELEELSDMGLSALPQFPEDEDDI